MPENNVRQVLSTYYLLLWFEYFKYLDVRIWFSQGSTVTWTKHLNNHGKNSAQRSNITVFIWVLSAGFVWLQLQFKSEMYWWWDGNWKLYLFPCDQGVQCIFLICN